MIGFTQKCNCKEDCLHLPLCDRCNQECCKCYSDNPFWDCTDAAHPAWWRGQEYGVKQAIKIFDDWLNNKKLDGYFTSDMEELKKKFIKFKENK